MRELRKLYDNQKIRELGEVINPYEVSKFKINCQQTQCLPGIF